jgi:hypothetical protein
VFYRGEKECRASRWYSSAVDLHRAMSGVRCEAGKTQIAKLLKHASAEAQNGWLDAVIFIGDAHEENDYELVHRASELGLMQVPVFVFHEIGDAAAEPVFRKIARASGGAYFRFGRGSKQQLRELLGAAAAFAAGGRKAMLDYCKRIGGATRPGLRK